MRLDQITYAVVERFMAETKPLLAGSTLNNISHYSPKS